MSYEFKQIVRLMGNIDGLCVLFKCPWSLQVIQFNWESSSISDTHRECLFFFPVFFSRERERERASWRKALNSDERALWSNFSSAERFINQLWWFSFSFFSFFSATSPWAQGFLADVKTCYPLSRLRRFLSFPLIPLFLLESNCFTLWLYSGYVSY